MSISTYAELKDAVANWVARSTLTAFVPDFIMLGESRIYRELRIRAMETALSSTIATGVIAVPSGYIELKFAYIDGTPVQRLTVKDPGWIYEYYSTRSADGKPSFIARDVDNFIFGPYPDSAYTVKGTYYKRLDALSVSNTTNWFTTNAPDLLLWASLCEAEPFMKNDERTQLWEAKYENVKQAIIKQDKRESHSGSPIVTTVSNY
jgi:hypothetical protein